MRFVALFWSSILCLSVCWLPQHASAKKIGVFPFQSIEPSLTKRELSNLSKKLIDQLHQMGLHTVVKKAPLAGVTPPTVKVSKSYQPQRTKDLAEINGYLKTATDQMGNSQFEGAIRPLKLGIRKAVKSVRWDATYNMLTRLCGLLSLAYLQLGRNDEGEFLLNALAVMQPKPLPPEISSNRIMKFRYKRALNDLKAKGSGSLQITGSTGATIYLDGRNQGKVPTVLSGLTVGIHYIRVHKKGFIPWGRALRVKKGVNQQNVELEALPVPTAPKTDTLRNERQTLVTAIQSFSFQSPETRRAIQRICSHTETDWILTGNLQKPSRNYLLTPFRIECNTYNVRRYEPVQVNGELLDLETVMNNVARIMQRKAKIKPSVAAVRPRPRATEPDTTDPDTSPPPERQATDPELPPDDRLPAVGTTSGNKSNNGNNKTGTYTPVSRQWWFWTLLGLGAAGAGVGIYIALQPPRVNVSASWQPAQ